MSEFAQFNVYRPMIGEIDREETKRYAGLKSGADFPAEIVEQACGKIMLLKAPAAVWSVYAYEPAGAIIKAAEPYVLPGRSLPRHLGTSSRVVFLAATVGAAAEAAVTEAFDRGEYALALLLDAAATAAVEQTADALGKLMSARFAGQGLQMTKRFSPGYGDWPLTEQKAACSLSGAAKIGIGLNESMMLTPRKSISAVIGLGCGEVALTGQSCAECLLTGCLLRREGTK